MDCFKPGRIGLRGCPQRTGNRRVRYWIMRRRSFLQFTAAMNVAASGGHLVAGQSASPPPGPDLHVVGSGEDRFGHPHSLGFSSLLFKIGSSETSGGLFLIEHRNLVRGGPPLHLHLYQGEWFYVMAGEVAFQVGDQRLRLHPGESVLAPRRVPHTFASVGAQPAAMLIAFCPAGKMEQYFRDMSGPNPPNMDAQTMRGYELELIGPNPLVK